MSKIHKISSVILAKNEEKNIRRCIESQLKCIDEIVVIVDESSTDKTLEIVKSYKDAKYIITSWKGYAQTKQEGVDGCSNDWIFWIDADEELTDELIDEINDLKNNDTNHSAFSVARRAYFLNKWIKYSGWYPGRVTRLFNRKNALFKILQVHEELDVSGTTGKLKNDLNHFTDPNLEHYYDKFNRYTSLAAIDLRSKNKKFKLVDILIRPTYLFIKMYILRRGFLDGLHGFILAVLSANYVFTKYCKLWELDNNKINKSD
ncbi:MAG: glycosyltransferase family 2 protein [Melioribacteraceae bacterium]|nr:glycosyltransferase family 2 protein [Melioribacteraceae bacterium]MCF8353490.1 glycosyltransferase family 2 protein [Melioribacteraceae bacterium]MCF8392619.1 glycosyltransferase family 2 protein [Melioribacteraceae bacterium]MCF8418509.1 glycosyltransferase family 2 protein [Melioribacteraceae bacterium]